MVPLPGLQIGSRSSVAPSGAAGGDLAGTYPNPTLALSVAAQEYPDTLVTPFDPKLAQSLATPGANGARYCRVICRKSGTLHDLYFYCTGSAGNVNAYVWDTSATTRNRLWTSGSAACPAISGWRLLGDPALTVVKGDQLDFMIAFDAAGGLAAGFSGSGVGAGTLPSTHWPSPLGGAGTLGGFQSSAFALSTTNPESSLVPDGKCPLLIARIT